MELPSLDKFSTEKIISNSVVARTEVTSTSCPEDIVCKICGDGDCDDYNMIVLCDGCDVAVHQLCYGIQQIPQGEWMCEPCSVGDRDVICKLCSQGGGAMKSTTSVGWSHLVCALWIPEVSIKDVILMESIDGIEKVPKERATLVCSICNNVGACIQCKERNCFVAYHPSCALRTGQHMEIRCGANENSSFDSFCKLHSQSKMTLGSMRRTTGPWSEGEALPELKFSCASVGPLIRKKYDLPALVVEEICKFWIEKRRNHVQPLVRRLQEYTDSMEDKKKKTNVQYKQNTYDQYLTMRLIRQGMERVRILLNLMKKREDLKGQQIKILTNIVEQQVNTGEGIPPEISFSIYTDMKNKQFSMFGIRENDDIFDLQIPEKRKRLKPDLKEKGWKRQKFGKEKKRKEEDVDYTPETVSDILSQSSNGEVFNLHCHHCKKRRPRCAICPYNITHRYCQNCVNRHFGADYEKLALSPIRFWKDGCPKCIGICPCAVCRNSSGSRKLYDNYTNKIFRKSPKERRKKKDLNLSSFELEDPTKPEITQTEPLTSDAQTPTENTQFKRSRGRPKKLRSTQKTFVTKSGTGIADQISLEPLFDFSTFNAEPLLQGKIHKSKKFLTFL